MEQIKIKCPDCGNVLLVKKISGIEEKSVKCPVCKQTNPFPRYRQLVDSPVEETDYRQQRPEKTEYGHTGNDIDIIPGMLVRTDGKPEVFKLKGGRNVVGRMCTSSTADIQIDTSPFKRMSRNHIAIDVKMVPGKGLVHYLSLCKKEINQTSVNGVQIFFGDSILLRRGDVLSLPDATFKFIIPDEDGTDI